MRDGFQEIVSGWTLISGTEDISDRIERAAKWAKANGPLEADEETTVKLMIESQIARHFDGDDGDPEDDFDFDCQLRPDGQCGAAGSEYCDFECPNRNSEFFAGSAAWDARHRRRKR